MIQVKTLFKHAGLLAVTLVGLWWASRAGPRWLQVVRLRQHVRRTQRTIAQLRHERAQLIDKIRQSTPDDAPDSAVRVAFMHEKTAREVLQRGRDSEVVYTV